MKITNFHREGAATWEVGEKDRIKSETCTVHWRRQGRDLEEKGAGAEGNGDATRRGQGNV